MKRTIKELPLTAKSEIPMEKHEKPQPKSTGGKKVTYGTEMKQPAHRIKK